MKTDEIRKGILHLRRNDEVLAKIIAAGNHFPLKPRRFYYRQLLKSIIGQQLSITVARVIIERFFRRFGRRPKPEEVLAAGDDELRALGISAQKLSYIKDLSEKVISGELKLDGISKLSDEEVIEELTRVKGIGEWTAHMFLIFTLRRLNILPTGDLGIRKAVMMLYQFDKLPTEDEVRSTAEKNNWQPYNSIASWYLWRSLEMQPEMTA
jgi:DNA-3-methyladenine glycosylase II